MLLTEFLEIKQYLRYCPACSWNLHDHNGNTAVRCCNNHGRIFSIQQTVNGYTVEVHLGDASEIEGDPAASNELPDVWQGPDIPWQSYDSGMS